MARTIERKHRTTISDESEVVRLYLDGWSAQKIGAKFGTTFGPVYRILRERGVKRSRTGERNRKLTDAAKQIALEAFAAGANGNEAAAAIGVSASTVSALLKSEGISSRRKVREFTPEEELKIVDRYRRGETGASIAVDYGVFHRRILSICARHGAKRRNPLKPSPWTDRAGRVFHFRSMWELIVAQYLDRESYDWDYEVRKFDLLIDGKPRSYKPDFWIYRNRALTLVDVKGRLHKDQQRRISAFLEQHPNEHLEIWDGRILRSLGLLDARGSVNSYG